MVGIFWVYKQQVVGRAIEHDSGEEGVPGLIDSADNHAEFWERAILFLHPELCGCEYFAVPRGRVLWDSLRARSIVYLDSSLLNQKSKVRIAEFFDLQAETTDWRTDAHYNTDKASLEQLFSDL